MWVFCISFDMSNDLIWDYSLVLVLVLVIYLEHTTKWLFAYTTVVLVERTGIRYKILSVTKYQKYLFVISSKIIKLIMQPELCEFGFENTTGIHIMLWYTLWTRNENSLSRLFQMNASIQEYFHPNMISSSYEIKYLHFY